MPKISNPQNFKGESLISKEELGLQSADVLVQNGQIASGFLPEFTGYKEDGTTKVLTEAPITGPKINFIGDCAMMVESDGSITIRIGENLNSSNFGTTDGKTTGVNTVKVTSPDGTAAYLNGTSVTAIKTGNYTIETTSANNEIHFDSNKNAGFKVVVEDEGTKKTYFFGPIDMTSGVVNNTKTFPAHLNSVSGTEVSNVQLEVANWGTEPLPGATGWKGNIKFTIPASAIADGNSSYVQVLSAGYLFDLTSETSKFNNVIASGSKLYYYTDTNSNPTITNTSLSLTYGNATWRSGVKCYDGITANYGMEFSNLNYPLGIAKNVTFDNSGFAGDQTLSITDATATNATSTAAVTNGAFLSGSANYVSYSAKNINGAATVSGETAVAKRLLQESIYVDNRLTPDTALSAYFNIEDSADYPRLISGDTGFTNFIPSASIQNTTDLQIVSGTLCWPSFDFSKYNGNSAGSNYSGVTTGTKRTWYRKFYEGGELNGATLTFEAASAIAATAFDKTLTVRIGILGSDGTVLGWYNACKKATETDEVPEADDGIATSVTDNVLTVDWGSNYIAKYGIIVELGMTANSHVIKTLTVAFA